MLKNDFKFLVRKEFSHYFSLKPPVIYLDSSSTAIKANSVIQQIKRVQEGVFSNPASRHRLGRASLSLISSTRLKILNFLDGKGGDLIFTSSATHSANVAANIFQELVREGDEILVWESSHASNLIPWMELAAKKKGKLVIKPFKEDFVSYLSQKTKIVALASVDNMVGIVRNLKKVVKEANRVASNVFVIVDGTQGILHLPISMKNTGVDAFFFSAHKIFGPFGVGALWVKKSVMESRAYSNLSPYMKGGRSWDLVTPDSVRYKTGYEKEESGTKNVSGIAGLGSAIDLLGKLQFKQISFYEQALKKYFLSKLKLINGVTIYSSHSSKIPIISFNLSNRDAYEVADFLDNNLVAAKAGVLCVPLLSSCLKSSAVVRISLTVYNTFEEIDRVIDLLQRFSKQQESDLFPVKK